MDITPAKRVYEEVRGRVEQGEARFLALSYKWLKNQIQSTA